MSKDWNFDLPIACEHVMSDADRARWELIDRQICELAGIAGVVSAAGLLRDVDMDKPEEITAAVSKLRAENAELDWFRRLLPFVQAVEDADEGYPEADAVCAMVHWMRDNPKPGAGT